MKKQKVFVAMSGGVDSSVAALRLKQRRYEVVGCFIKGWYPRGFACNWQKDRRDAMKVCNTLGIPFLSIDLEKDYKKMVVDYMIREYGQGRTPNPDVMCNLYIKFGAFLDRALELGADLIATGHYARVRKEKTEMKLLQAKDKEKDQTYFLWTLNQKQLKRVLFPVGDLVKSEVRQLARKANLTVADKEESMGVCFIGEFKMMDFLQRYLPGKEGWIITSNGKKLGKHKGAWFYTIGQRHGFGIGGGIPFYIVKKDIKNNILIVANRKEEVNFYTKEVDLIQTNWIRRKPEVDKAYRARIRHGQPLQSCKLKSLGRTTAKVVFKQAQRAVAAGQSLVLYSRQEVVGGGIIV
jgi:tRNA-specific 2-thiouridylase